jgi:uncharacterized radical SAM superfamily Fe-S cluster-containing enzyme
MMGRDKDYSFREATTSICPHCLSSIPAKIILKNNSIYIMKHCPEHGEQTELLEEDADYFIRKEEFDKPGTLSKCQTSCKKGCPFDCGLCTSHEQHTCIALIEVTNNCDLKCPVCFAHSGNGEFLDLKTIEKMMDFYQDSEYNQAEILQISGGEPTTHPQILEILKLAKDKKFRYVMLNTNGLRISEDKEFTKALSTLNGGFEIYLQFDGFNKDAYKKLRGRDLTEVKKKAIENLTTYKIPITLVCTVEKDVNDSEIGKILKFGIETKYIRGVNFQPIAFFGRVSNSDIQNRITLTGVINRMEKQTKGMVRKSDFIPLPCNVNRVAVTYLYKKGEEFIPITRNAKIKEYLPLIKNTFAFRAEDVLGQSAKELLKGNFCDCLNFLKDFLPLVPMHLNMKSKEQKMMHVSENTFRITVTSFIDAYNFDMKSMKKECVHILTPDLKRIPFSSYNMIYREKYAKPHRDN